MCLMSRIIDIFFLIYIIFCLKTTTKLNEMILNKASEKWHRLRDGGHYIYFLLLHDIHKLTLIGNNRSCSKRGGRKHRGS